MTTRQTHTYAELEVSKAAYDEIAILLHEAKYDHAFMEDGTIDMHGIGITRAVTEVDRASARKTAERCQTCGRTDEEYRTSPALCSDPWHSDDHLRK